MASANYLTRFLKSENRNRPSLQDRPGDPQSTVTGGIYKGVPLVPSWAIYKGSLPLFLRESTTVEIARGSAPR